MATLIAFSILDKKLESFTPPFFAPNKAVVLRDYGNLVKENRDAPMAKNPDDFALYIVGSFDDDLGNLVSIGDTGQSIQLVVEFADLV